MKSGQLKSKNNQVGAVLVVGGGIGGIQAALDLAESGYYVYLVEKSPSVGGAMAQLDKTFPTCDCSICILSPKLVECGRHPNIEILSYSELLEVEGEPGNFKAKVLKHPRFIDPQKCTGCGECAEVCPVRLPSEFDQGLAERKAIFKPFAQAYPPTFAIDKRERPPCTLTCPAGTNVQGYIALTRERKYREALSLIKENIPLPGVLGRICSAPCEERCNRSLLDEPISIRALKRFIADSVEDEESLPEIKEKEEKVAVIGSGPAGLTCAYFLRREGYEVTIFEALPVIGGMLYVGIPEYRLPKDVLQKEVEGIKRLGMEIKTNVSIGKDLSLDDLFQQGYKAAFIGIGAHESQRLRVPGEGAEGVTHGLNFLRDFNLKKGKRVRGKVAVIGGGDVAIDSARTALRVGAEEVFIIYRRSRVEMPAREEEVEAAEAEGVKIDFLVAPVEILTQNGRVAGIKSIRMELGEPDATGRRRPIPIPGSEFEIKVDIVIPAIGQASDLSFLKNSGVELTKQGTVKVDSVTLETSRKGVFAGGDCQTGPSIAIEAVAAGKRAAESIIRYLRGQDLKQGRIIEERKLADWGAFIPWEKPKEERQEMLSLSVEERISNFKEIESGFSEEMALREANRCLNCGLCSECLQCVTVCKAEAIVHDMKEEIVEIKVGSVILSPGFDEFDPTPFFNYGYKKYLNVVTSIEFERMLSASGPYQGELLRLSDKKSPRRIAWIQCVGSRDASCNREYCSSVCCTYAIKEAIVAKEHVHYELEETIFFMDMRTQGKGFERFYERAKEEGIKFVRAKVYQVEELDGTGNLVVRYLGEDGKIATAEFDLVVLSVGLQPSPEAIKLAKRLGIQLNPHGFCYTSTFTPVETSKLGVFVCGAFSGPKDIPETVMQASGAAGSASALLAPARKTLVKEKVYPLEKDVAGQEPRIGVFVCHCGINIGGVVNVPEVREYAATLPNVVFADANLYTCSQDTQEKIKQMIEEHNLNRVIVASCSPRTHEPLFQETIREAGLNKYLFEMANIRDHCSWVHRDIPEEATRKAKELVKMTVAKAALIQPLPKLTIPVIPRALIIGGGVAGMRACLELANQGFECFLIERSGKLGGNARRLRYTLEGDDLLRFLEELIQEVEEHRLIHIYKNAAIKEISGYIGNFKTRVFVEGKEDTLEHGVIIVATGGREYQPSEYLYGKHEKVLTQLELEEKLAEGSLKPEELENVVMIQCVGSRMKERLYCSKVCCAQAVKNALKIKELNPSSNIYILYKDMRTYSFKEEFYQKARDAGVTFLRYPEEKEPEVTIEDGRIKVKVFDPVLGEELIINSDLLVLSVGILAEEGNEELAKMLKVPLNEDSFFLEAHVKLRPVEFATEGIFVAGLAHSPKPIEEAISQALAAAGKAAIPLSKGSVSVEPIVSSVDEEKCIGCGLCELLCAFSAIRLVSKNGTNKAETIPASCKGCGLCAANCPQQAISMGHFRDEEIIAQVKALAVV